MAKLRFNHVLVFLLLIGVLSSLVLPGQFGDHFKQIDLIFAPVSKPSRLISLAITGHFSAKPKPPTDDRNRPLTVEELARQRDELLSQLSNVQSQLEDLKKRNEERNKLGDARRYCEPFAVIGGDTAPNRQSLSIEAEADSSASRVDKGMAVLYPQGLVGRVSSAGVGSARVQLITDIDFHVTGTFGRWVKKSQSAPIQSDERPGERAGDQYALTPLPCPPVSISGNGHGKMRIAQLRLDQVKEYGLKIGDMVRLNDLDGWPAAAQGEPLGTIESITPNHHQPLFADIIVAPRADLMKLREVMVMDRLNR